MLPPRRHRQRTEACPNCHRALGELKTPAKGDQYLLLSDCVRSVVINDDVLSYCIVCICGYDHAWNGTEITWVHPLKRAA